jgi:hypothetical protein
MLSPPPTIPIGTNEPFPERRMSGPSAWMPMYIGDYLGDTPRRETSTFSLRPGCARLTSAPTRYATTGPLYAARAAYMRQP